MFRSIKFTGLILSLVFTTLLVACGASGTDSKGSEASPASISSAAASASPSPTEAVKTFEHSLGKTEVKGTPKRIVALEWTYVEELLAVGVQPVGVADIKGYKQWVNVQPSLAADVTDVGTRQEPSLEAIAALKPDLIIAVNFRVKSNYEALSKIAPTLTFDPYPVEGKGDQYTEMEQTFKTIADLVGKKAEAEKVLAELQTSYDTAKAKLKSAGKEGAPFTLTQAFSNQNAADLRLFTDNSMAVQILQKIGLKNVYKSEKFENYGYATKNVEALPAVQDSNFIYIVQDNDNVFEKQLKDNAVWKGLAFVKENRTYHLPGNTWPFGGPLSAKVFAELVTAALTK